MLFCTGFRMKVYREVCVCVCLFKARGGPLPYKGETGSLLATGALLHAGCRIAQ